MANYQVLFNGEVAEQASRDAVRENLARELGIDERKAKQLFSGRTVVIRSQLEQHQALAWQEKLAQFGAICRIKNLAPKEARPEFKTDKAAVEQTLRDITAAHLECPRCGHMQLDSSHCARCGVDLEQAFKAKRKEDLLIEKKIRELRSKQGPGEPLAARPTIEPEYEYEPEPEPEKKGVLRWFKR